MTIIEWLIFVLKILGLGFLILLLIELILYTFVIYPIKQYKFKKVKEKAGESFCEFLGEVNKETKKNKTKKE